MIAPNLYQPKPNTFTMQTEKKLRGDIAADNLISSLYAAARGSCQTVLHLGGIEPAPA